MSKEKLVEGDPIRLEVGPVLGARCVVSAGRDYISVQSVSRARFGAEWANRKPLAELSRDGGVTGAAEVRAGGEARNGGGSRVRRADADCAGSGVSGDNVPRIPCK